jgi:anti-anti-sigma factor
VDRRGNVAGVTAPHRLESPTGLRPGDHVCWTYADAAALAAAMLPYLDEGRRRGEQLVVVGESHDGLVDALAELPDRDRLLAGGQLELRTTADAYVTGAALSPAEQVERYRGDTQAALDSGRTGLRVAADITALARSGPAARRQLHDYERLADTLMGVVPMTALCLYDAALADDVLEPVAVLHPAQHLGDRQPIAHLSGRGPALSLHGEVDITQAGAVARALVDVAGDGPADVVVDLADLVFLDIAGARALARAVQLLAERGVRLWLVGARRSPARCLALVGLPDGPAGPA